MLQMTLLRVLLLLGVGILLYWALLNMVGFLESRYLKKRRKTLNTKQSNSKAGIICIYVFALTVGIMLVFLAVEGGILEGISDILYGCYKEE